MRLPQSFKWRVALAYTALIFITMGAVSFYLIGFVRNTYFSNLEERLRQEAALLGLSAASLTENLGVPIQSLALDFAEAVDGRVIVMRSDGTVLADSAAASPNASDPRGAPEIQAALSFGFGRDMRLDAALGEEMMFVAVPIESRGQRTGVVSVGASTSRIEANLRWMIVTIAISALIVALLSVSLGYLLARPIARSVHSVAEGARRLAQGDLDHQVRALSTDETQELADAFNRMAATIKDMLRDVSSGHSKLSAILDTMADGVVVIESDGRVAIINAAAEQLLDVKSRSPNGSRISQITRDHEVLRLIGEAMRSGQPHFGELELLHRRRFLSVIATPISDNGSQGVLLTLHDLTRIRQVETTRKEFVSNVSHELRNPLASIKAMVETLESGALEDQAVARNFLERIHRDVDRMNSMVNDLLELSRLETGQIALHLAPMSLPPLVDDTVTQCRAQAVTKEVLVESKVPADLPLVVGEEDKLREVL
ncbi:MAG: cell wall metabolism sensor histidine kinase WalK, partial [Chloroflexi bacterium]|nr:cell wall metabolism sensor histidine kinase WalK [Chloroflexota bacterium]